MRLELGKQARLADGTFRDLVDVVIDANTNRVTHVVVEPKDEPVSARLVPMSLVEDGGRRHGISLSCTTETLEAMEPVRRHTYVGSGETEDQAEAGWDVGVEDMQALPQYSAGFIGEVGPDLAEDVLITYDRVPKGEVELRHASAVYSADEHHMGSVEGVVVGSDDEITHLLLERGHLWWRRELAVPANAVSQIKTDMVVLGVNKSQLSAAADKG
jgi:sporulation protein YlmC with PRC-barrel domain